jgi:hypothetical protein
MQLPLMWGQYVDRDLDGMLVARPSEVEDHEDVLLVRRGRASSDL